MKEGIDAFILTYFVAVNSLYCALIVLGMLEVVRRRSTRLPELDATVLASDSTPPVSLIAPAYNEAETIVESVRAFLQLEYPEHQVIVVNDGSTDDTLERLRARFDLVPLDLVVREEIESKPIHTIYASRTDPRLWVVDKPNGGKADALNAGINVARTPLICCCDADTIVERSALLRMVEPFFYDPSGVIAVGGSVRIANGCTIEDGVVTDVSLPDGWLPRFQLVEYLRAFLFGRMGYNRLGGNLIISGAFGMFDRQAIVDVGGYESATVGEDMELVVKLQRHAYDSDPPRRIVHIPEPICYTEVPDEVAVLGRQRDRWQRGLADSLWRHRAMMLNPNYGQLGLIGYPLFVVFELFGPLIELFGYGYFAYALFTGQVSWPFAVLFFVVAFAWGSLLSLMSLLVDWWSFKQLEGKALRRRLVLTALMENLGYRQLTLFYRLRGMLGFLLGNKSWGKMRRRGFERAETTTAEANA